MSANPFVGEVELFAGDFAPKGYAFCDGSLLAIAQNTALFSLLGTTYGGDGKTNFALPDLRGRHAVGYGQAPGLSLYEIGEQGGEESVSLTVEQIPAHRHTPATASSATSTDPTNKLWAPAAAGTPYGELAGGTPTKTASACTMAVDALAPGGGNEAHENRPPSLALSFIIALQGVFPPRS